ncbi:hypothetical protein [Paratractidigestivibacter faecalis]|uniref:hypothetical protein n=1 Tax=Paratractidigestivibacter faecalis TaxID=2292441 RepID=UPI000E3DB7CC|nr:hypothetical protein [Paratractidigestivibacter faecalis]
MRRRPLYAELSCGGRAVRLDGIGRADGLHVTSDGIEGWWDTPDPKWTLTERQSADGAHDVAEGMALYSARTVTVHAAALGADREATKALLDSVLSMAHETVRLRVVDGSEDTWCEGLLSASVGTEWHERAMTMDLTVVCPDPRRQATAAELSVLLPAAASLTAGLSYGEGGLGLAYPLDYGKGALDARNVCTVTNHGTSTAWPTIRVSRGMADVELLAACAGRSSTLSLAGTCTTEVTIDCRTRTAATARMDVTRRLTGAGALGVPAGETMRLVLLSAGTGSVSVELRDTYI